MLRDKNIMLVFTVVCCLCGWTRPMDAMTLPTQETTEASDVQTLGNEMSSTQNIIMIPISTPAMAQKASVQATLQNIDKVSLEASTASMQAPSGLSFPISNPAMAQNASVQATLQNINKDSLEASTASMQAPSGLSLPISTPATAQNASVQATLQNINKVSLEASAASMQAPSGLSLPISTPATAQNASVQATLQNINKVSLEASTASMQAPSGLSLPISTPAMAQNASVQATLQNINKVSLEASAASMQAPSGLSLPISTPAMAQNASVQATLQNINKVSLEASTASMQAPSGLSWPTGIPLSMSLNSVDDMYYGCSHRMLIKVKRHHLPKSTKEELHSTYTKLCALKALKTKDAYDGLSWNHFKALCAYTAGAYAELNQAVRREKSSYKTSFEFHALHFLLSDAIQILKVNQRSCFKTYRRSKLHFVGKEGQTIRFGSFASSSLNEALRNFGRRTCFEIHTCFGAYLKSYTEFDSDEDEVLIPPYEMFTIVAVDTSGENDLQCDVVYKLETAGVYSSLNCQAVE